MATTISCYTSSHPPNIHIYELTSLRLSHMAHIMCRLGKTLRSGDEDEGRGEERGGGGNNGGSTEVMSHIMGYFVVDRNFV
jgi:hypothetical protein